MRQGIAECESDRSATVDRLLGHIIDSTKERHGFEKPSFVGIRRRKLCGQQIFGPQNFKTHVIIQNAGYSSKISFLTHRSYCHATYLGEQWTSHSKVILPSAESTDQGEDGFA